MEDPEGVDTSWYNTDDTTFTISNAEQLKGLAYLVNGGTSFRNKTIKLGDSIDLHSEAWTPIGTATHKFYGSFDGNGKTISNLSVSGNNNVALFGNAGAGDNEAVIKNLTLNHVNASGTSYVGGLVAAGVGSISACTVTGNISITGTNNYVGGIAAHGYWDISGCVVSDTVGEPGVIRAGVWPVGGIIGFTGEGVASITGCSAQNLTITGGAYGVGGIVGYASEGKRITGNTVAGCTVSNDHGYDHAGVASIAGTLEGKNLSSIVANNTVDSATAVTHKGASVNLAADIYPGEGAMVAIGAADANDAVVVYDSTARCYKVVSGSFDTITEAVLAPRSEMSFNDDGTYSVKHYVAAIGEKKYETLAAALAEAEEGSSITLLENVTEDVTLNKSLTLALGSHTLKAKITIPAALELTIEGTGTGSAITLTAPAKEGFVFGGWYTDESFSDDSAAAKQGDDYTALPGNTYYPKWDYAISFDGNGADGGTVAALTAGAGESISLPENSFTKTGHRFTGWNTKADGTGTAYAAAASAAFTANTTLYAQWTVNQYTITFVTDGGSSVSPITKNYGAAVTAPAAPTKEGYSFAGWDKTIPATMPAEDLTITARWNVNQYTITFANTGETAIEDIQQNYGTPVTAPADPTQTGYTFAGWDRTIPATMPAWNLTITARWNVNEYEVVFHANGGEGTMESQTLAYGSGQNLSANAFTNGDKRFAGWATTERGDVAYADGVRVLNLTAEDGAQIHLYAVWTDKEVLKPDLRVQTYTYNGKPQGFRLEDGFTVTYSRRSTEAPTDAGVYDVTVTRAATDTTAAFHTTIPGGLVIEKATLKATYTGETIYVGAEPSLLVRVTGFVGGETAATAAGYVAPKVDAPGTAQGTYTLTPYGGEADNYDFDYVSGKLVIKVKVPYEQDPDKLPQTGSATGPGLILMAAGLVAMCFGALFVLRRKKGRYEA